MSEFGFLISADAAVLVVSFVSGKGESASLREPIEARPGLSKNLKRGIFCMLLKIDWKQIPLNKIFFRCHLCRVATYFTTMPFSQRQTALYSPRRWLSVGWLTSPII